MRLSDLTPKLHESGTLEFDCPAGHPHRVFALIGEGAWTQEGAFPETLTLRPSILAQAGAPFDDALLGDEYDRASKCGWHGFITNGEVTTC
jgi:hypothetical protein